MMPSTCMRGKPSQTSGHRARLRIPHRLSILHNSEADGSEILAELRAITGSSPGTSPGIFCPGTLPSSGQHSGDVCAIFTDDKRQQHSFSHLAASTHPSYAAIDTVHLLDRTPCPCQTFLRRRTHVTWF